MPIGLKWFVSLQFRRASYRPLVLFTILCTCYSKRSCDWFVIITKCLSLSFRSCYQNPSLQDCTREVRGCYQNWNYTPSSSHSLKTHLVPLLVFSILCTRNSIKQSSSPIFTKPEKSTKPYFEVRTRSVQKSQLFSIIIPTISLFFASCCERVNLKMEPSRLVTFSRVINNFLSHYPCPFKICIVPCIKIAPLKKTKKLFIVILYFF